MVRRRGWKPYTKQGADGRWYWGFRSATGETVVVGGQGYTRRWSAIRAALVARLRMQED